MVECCPTSSSGRLLAQKLISEKPIRLSRFSILLLLHFYPRQMDQLCAFEAILFPCDGRQPHLVALMTSPMSYQTYYGAYSPQTSRLPHPEHYMSFVAEGLGPRAWKYHLIEALDGMNKKFANPYIVFYPTVSRDGRPFPANRCIREIQGKLFREELAWRGDIIIAKYRDDPWTSMIDASMADFPILKNYLLTHGAPLH